MSKKFFYFLLTAVLMASLTACNKTNTTNNPSNSNNPVSTTQPTMETPPSQTSESANTNPEANLQGKKPIPVNVSVPDAKLPQDIPVFPSAKPLEKKLTNKITSFIFSTDASHAEVANFYKDALKKEGWIWRIEQQNVADGYFFVKPKRTVRVISYKDGELNKTVFRLNVFDAEESNTTMEIMGQDGKVAKKVEVANLSESARMPNIMGLVAPYPGAQKKITEKPGIWLEFKTKDPVKKIADWYDKELKKSGWSLEQDNSELGDSMIIYNKKDEKGNKVNVGIRVNDIKEKSERWITVINYPYNAVIPDVDPISKVEQEQPEAAKVAKELAKKNQEKNKTVPPKEIEITPEMKAQFAAQKQAAIENRGKATDAQTKAKEKAIAEAKKNQRN